MTWFLYVAIFLWVLATIGKVVWLTRGDLPPRNRLHEILDVVMYVALTVWAIALLVVQR